jgi:hypothetical protein
MCIIEFAISSFFVRSKACCSVALRIQGASNNSYFAVTSGAVMSRTRSMQRNSACAWQGRGGCILHVHTPVVNQSSLSIIAFVAYV